jgi:hypothetical protein
VDVAVGGPGVGGTAVLVAVLVAVGGVGIGVTVTTTCTCGAGGGGTTGAGVLVGAEVLVAAGTSVFVGVGGTAVLVLVSVGADVLVSVGTAVFVPVGVGDGPGVMVQGISPAPPQGADVPVAIGVLVAATAEVYEPLITPDGARMLTPLGGIRTPPLPDCVLVRLIEIVPTSVGRSVIV